MDTLLLIARILFVAVFVGSAIGHLTQASQLAGYAASKGVPAAKALTVVTGVQLLVGSVLVLLGVWGDLGAALIAAFLVPTAFLMHAFWKETDPQAKMMEQTQFNKDISLAGGALALVVAFSTNPGLTLTDALF